MLIFGAQTGIPVQKSPEYGTVNVSETDSFTNNNLVDIYLLKLNNRNTRIRYKICSKLTIKTPKRCYWRRSGLFIINFEHVNADWAQPAITCSKLTIDTLEQGEKHVQS